MPPLDTMENMASSSSDESLTSRSTESMEIDTMSVLENSPQRSDTPANDDPADLVGTDTEKSIVVNAPSMIMGDLSFMSNGIEGDDDDEKAVSYTKRKRTSTINYDDGAYSKMHRGSPYGDASVKRSKPGKNMRGVIVGVWRESSEPNDEDKQVIFGFIDIHDRLRTRIYAMDRRGEELQGNVPAGAGGCWVTFERIIFDKHLRGLSAAEIKEYVKIRSEVKPEPDLDDRAQADALAVIEAKKIVVEQEALIPGGKPGVPRTSKGQRQSLNQTTSPHQSFHKTPSFQAVNAADMQTPKTSPYAESKPQGVLLGYWADSDEPRLEDKHAVFGILSGTDSFRVKVQRVTRDGRYVDGNYPIGAGAFWLSYKKVVLEPHLASMTRMEVKEYVRIRQSDLENRETDKERKVNEARAAQRARVVVAEQGLNTGVELGAASPTVEIRHSARAEHRLSARHQAETDAVSEQVRKEKAEARERQNEKTRREVAMAEAGIQESAQMELKNNIKKLNKVWVAQQAATGPRPKIGGQMVMGENEVKYHHGIKYERKQNGPFQGKLVSQAQILNIDGEDYVEYRVLTKPSF